MVTASWASRGVPLAGALRALCDGILTAGAALRSALARRTGARVRVDKCAQEQALRLCLASAAARPARAVGRRERPGREPGVSVPVRRPGPDRLPCLLGFVPDGWGRDLTLAEMTGYDRLPRAGVDRNRAADLGERAIGGR